MYVLVAHGLAGNHAGCKNVLGFGYGEHACTALSSSQSATQIVLGGSWFSKSSVGTSGGYMIAHWRSKVLDPIMSRVAEMFWQTS